ncbi:glycosyltransferase family 2 protein [Rahnella inusitata]|uniref:glycosyltransferase family 2 protein n=1 Tax=Rahnella inusitata TaxID=58169 RepID=UPI0039AEA8C0
MKYVVILNWKNAQSTLECVESVLKIDDPELVIVVCDNNSCDDSLSYIERSLLDRMVENNINIAVINEQEIKIESHNEIFSKVVLIQNDKNYGYAGGNNVGIRFGLNDQHCTFIWVLNNDTIVQKDSLNYMIDVMNNDPNVGICGSLLILKNNPQIIQGIGGAFNKFLSTTQHIEEFKPLLSVSMERKIRKDIDYIIGASMLIRADVFKKIGLLFEDYFLYFEEIDFCLRAAQYYELAVAVESHVYHDVGLSTNGGRSNIADYCAVRNRLIVSKRFYPYTLPLVWFSLAGVLANRIKRREFIKARNVVKIMLIDSIKIFFKYKKHDNSVK